MVEFSASEKRKIDRAWNGRHENVGTRHNVKLKKGKKINLSKHYAILIYFNRLQNMLRVEIRKNLICSFNLIRYIKFR